MTNPELWASRVMSENERIDVVRAFAHEKFGENAKYAYKSTSDGKIEIMDIEQAIERCGQHMVTDQNFRLEFVDMQLTAFRNEYIDLAQKALARRRAQIVLNQTTQKDAGR